MKRRTVSGGEVVIRGPSRIESMPNMRNGLGPTKRRERSAAAAANARTNGAAVNVARRTRAKPTTVRYSTDAEDDHGATTPPQTATSRSSSVVVNVEATGSVCSVVDRTTSLPPPQPARLESPVSPTSGEWTRSLQSPVNSSGVRIVIDSDDDDDNDEDGGREWSLGDVDHDAAAGHQGPLSDAQDTAVAATTFGTASSINSEEDSTSDPVVLFQCGPGDDVDDDVTKRSRGR